MKSYSKPIENLEQRRMFTTVKGNDTVTITAADRSKENYNDVVLTFDGNLRSGVDISKIRFYSYAANTLTGGQQKVTIPVTSATASGDKLTIRTGAQVRKGAYLQLNAGAVKDSAGADATGDIRLKKGLNKDRFTLAMRAFTPNDKSYFSSTVLTGGRAPIVANVAESDSAVRAQLSDFLAKKVKEKTISEAKRTDALAKYDNATNKTVIGAHNLRAAVVSLVGTVAEPAIDVWLGTGNTTGKVPIFVGFNTADLSPGANDVELAYNTKNRLKLTFKSDYAGESFAALSARIAGETFQDGGINNNVDDQDEEVVSNFVETAVWAQQIVTDFRYAQKGTTYTLYNNYHLYTLLNSGDRQFPRVGIVAAPLKNGGTNATPGFIQSTASFDALIRRELQGRISDKGDSPITGVTAQILNNVAGGKYTSSATKFGDELIASIDISQGVLGDSFAMRAARVLQVKVF